MLLVQWLFLVIVVTLFNIMRALCVIVIISGNNEHSRVRSWKGTSDLESGHLNSSLSLASVKLWDFGGASLSHP